MYFSYLLLHVVDASDPERRDKIKAVNVINCSLCNQCVDICELDAVNVSTTGRDFVFIIESTGSLKTKEILLESLKVLKEKTQTFKKHVDDF